MNTDPSKYASPDPNIVHLLAAYEWQHLYIAEMAGICDNMPTKKLKNIALDHGMLQGRAKGGWVCVAGIPLEFLICCVRPLLVLQIKVARLDFFRRIPSKFEP